MARDVPNDALARLIRATLDADAKEVDAIDLEARICRELADRAEKRAATRFPMNWRSKLHRTSIRVGVIAASLLVGIGVFGFLTLPTSAAHAYALVESAHQSLQEGVDREYAVTVENAPWGSLDDARLWTRGDRYRVELQRGKRKLVWGKDEHEIVWLVCSPKKGLSFRADEIPREASALLSYLSLDLRDLTSHILHDCELTFSEGMKNRRKGIKTINAVPKSKGNVVEFSTAQVDIDESTKAIRRLELTRKVNGAEQGRYVFRWVGDNPQPDASYRLDSHLSKDAVVLDQSRFKDRMAELFRAVREFRNR